MMMSKSRYAFAIITVAVILGLLVAVGLVGCGGGDEGPAASAVATSTAEQAAGEGVVGPSAGPDLGDMDSDGIPTGNDAQLIMAIVVDPHNEEYDAGEKYIADCNSNGVVETGDALKVLRAAAGEIDWPFPTGGPPPPPVPPPDPEAQPPPPPPI